MVNMTATSGLYDMKTEILKLNDVTSSLRPAMKAA